MLEIRWVDVGGGNLQLQQRTRFPHVDAFGLFCAFSDWSDWSAVPIVHGEMHARSVVDVFGTK